MFLTEIGRPIDYMVQPMEVTRADENPNWTVEVPLTVSSFSIGGIILLAVLPAILARCANSVQHERA